MSLTASRLLRFASSRRPDVESVWQGKHAPAIFQAGWPPAGSV